MRYGLPIACFLLLLLTPVSVSHSEKHGLRHKGGTAKQTSTTKNKAQSLWPNSRFRGWDYLVGRLQELGVSKQDLLTIYGDSRMPERTFVPFSVQPKEPSSIYEGFKHKKYQKLGRDFISRHTKEFNRIEKTLLVPKEVVAAIIVIESGAGQNTGKHLLIYRLSRLATTNAPDNLQENYLAQKKIDPHVIYEDVRQRGRYLERTFLPEIPALITIAKRNNVDILSMKGSSAGAFGLPQFLPSAFLRFGLDGNMDGLVSLHNETDAIWSAANYLASFGYQRNIPSQEKRAIIWRYNKSASYIDAVLLLTERLQQ